jgi:hypothetical protein
MRLLPKPKIIISYADTEQNHTGYVYQAANFIYCGLTEKRTNWTIEGLEGMHGQTVADKYRNVENRAEAIRQEYGDRFSLRDRSRKHRYIYFVGTKKEKKRFDSRRQSL